MSWITNNILTLHGALALVIIFLLPALEASAFVGFIFPGETAVILGGVLAYEHRIPLAAAMAAASAGAIIGDSVGYYIGKRWGHYIIERLSGRLVKASTVHGAVSYIARRGGVGVFIGRFTTALRVLVPGAAGMAGMHYRKFLFYNALGGVCWAVGFSILGYLAGASFHKVEKTAGTISYVLLGLVVAALVGRVLYKHFRPGDDEEMTGEDISTGS
ncbi:MAG: DedA family protein [Acidimicrobiaceae bacterium]|nr:DedA family protein [Acidimicrobiaceae bacterium]